MSRASGQMAGEADSEVLLIDSFTDGLDLTRTWALTTIESFTADDGVVTASAGGLHVRSSGINAGTGEPAFALSAEGELDHLKWMADTRHVSSEGYPGFDAAPGRLLSCTMWGGGRTFGTDDHPFGGAVGDPQSDLRLASFAMNVIDDETGLVFDTWQTNTRIYPYYERLETSGRAAYQRFSSIFPGVPRSPDSEDKVSLVYDPSAGAVRWIINDRDAARVEQIGFPAPEATILIDRGGTPELAAPRQLNCGMAMFTLMDGGAPRTGDGLASLGGAYRFPTSFVEGPTLFGQGAEMHVRRFEVRSAEADPPTAGDAD
jgi:Family of unknown function (DUF6081)